MSVIHALEEFTFDRLGAVATGLVNYLYSSRAGLNSETFTVVHIEGQRGLTKVSQLGRETTRKALVALGEAGIIELSDVTGVKVARSTATVRILTEQQIVVFLAAKGGYRA